MSNQELEFDIENNIKSNNYYKQQVLSMMTNSDIACIISDKYEELKEEKLDNKNNITRLHLRGEDRLMCI